MISLKNPSASISLSPTEARPLLLVTTESGQQQTKAVAQSRRLPLNGRLATVASTKQRQQPSIPTANHYHHHTVNESGTNQRPTARKYVSSRPRAALFFTSPRTCKTVKREGHFLLFVFVGGPDQSPEQHQPLLASSGNDTSSRHDSIDSHTSTDDGFGPNDGWPVASRFVPDLLRTNRKALPCAYFRRTPLTIRSIPMHPMSSPISTVQPRPQAMQNSRQLPPLPIPIRQLPTSANSDSAQPYFDVDDAENDELVLASRFTRPGELFYYQTSSSSTSDSSSPEHSDHDDHNEQQFPVDIQDEENDDDDDEDDDEQTSPCEYEAWLEILHIFVWTIKVNIQRRCDNHYARIAPSTFDRCSHPSFILGVTNAVSINRWISISLPCLVVWSNYGQTILLFSFSKYDKRVLWRRTDWFLSSIEREKSFELHSLFLPLHSPSHSFDRCVDPRWYMRRRLRYTICTSLKHVKTLISFFHFLTAQLNGW